MRFENLSKEAKNNAIINYIHMFGAFAEDKTVSETFEDLTDSCDYAISRDGSIYSTEALYTLHDMRTLEPWRYIWAIEAAMTEADRMSDELQDLEGDDDLTRYWKYENMDDLEKFCLIKGIWFDYGGSAIYL